MYRVLSFLIVIALFTHCKKDDMPPTVQEGPLTTISVNDSPYENYWSSEIVDVDPNPNVTSDSVTVSIYAPRTTNCTIKVAMGKNTRTTFSGVIEAGSYKQRLYFRDYTAGVVYVQVELNDKIWAYPLFLRKI